MTAHASRPVFLPGCLTEPFVYVDGGARGETANALVDTIPSAVYHGFEPDQAECARLIGLADPARFRYHPVALAATTETRTLYVTRNPACSSLLRPNQELMSGFAEVGPFFEIAATTEVETASLDDQVASGDISHVDFLELDVQGGALEALQGARRQLATCVLGLQVEVEFEAMYQEQPLFADVDRFVREAGPFTLFDVSRYRLRRASSAPDVPTRGQLLWGHAVYLRRPDTLSDQLPKALKLAVLASFLRFHDYALEIIDHVLESTSLSRSEAADVRAAADRYRHALRPPAAAHPLRRFARFPLRWLSATASPAAVASSATHHSCWSD